MKGAREGIMQELKCQIPSAAGVCITCTIVSLRVHVRVRVRERWNGFCPC
jgi:hypothetical protein